MNYEFWVLGDQTIQMYGNFEGFLFFFVHCLDRQYKGSVKTHKLAQWKTHPLKMYFLGSLRELSIARHVIFVYRTQDTILYVVATLWPFSGCRWDHSQLKDIFLKESCYLEPLRNSFRISSRELTYPRVKGNSAFESGGWMGHVSFQEGTRVSMEVIVSS